MEILAPTDFASACFTWRGPRLSLTVIAKATFRIASPQLRLVDGPTPLVRGAEDPDGNPSYPDDFVPWKASPEVFVVGHAKAASPQREIAVGVEVGDWSKRCLAESEIPAFAIPLGRAHLRDDRGAPMELGPTAPRGEVWNERELAPGFDYHHFNFAPDDQRLSRIEPGAELVLRALDATSPLRTRLADWRPSAALQLVGDAPRSLPLRCDTLWLHVDAQVAVAVWRGMWTTTHRDELPFRLYLDGADTPLDADEVVDRRERARREGAGGDTKKSRTAGRSDRGPAGDDRAGGRGRIELSGAEAAELRRMLLEHEAGPLSDRVSAGHPDSVDLSHPSSSGPMSIDDADTVSLHALPAPTTAMPIPRTRPAGPESPGEDDPPIEDAPTRDERGLPAHLREALRHHQEDDGAATLEIDDGDPTLEDPKPEHAPLPESLAALLDGVEDTSDGRRTLPREDLDAPPADTGATPVLTWRPDERD